MDQKLYFYIFNKSKNEYERFTQEQWDSIFKKQDIKFFKFSLCPYTDGKIRGGLGTILPPENSTMKSADIWNMLRNEIKESSIFVVQSRNYTIDSKYIDNVYGQDSVVFIVGSNLTLDSINSRLAASPKEEEEKKIQYIDMSKLSKEEIESNEGIRAFREVQRIFSGNLTEEESEDENLVNAVRKFNGLGQETNEYASEFNELIEEGILQQDYFEKMDKDEKKGKICSISGKPADYKVINNYCNGLEEYKTFVDFGNPDNTDNIPHNLIDKALEIEYISQEVYDKLASTPCDGCTGYLRDDDMCTTCLTNFMGVKW